MPKGTILAVDDDQDLQFVVSQYLEGDGYTVVQAGDVKTAVEKSMATKFDVILLDLMLPDGEGIDLIPAIRAQTSAAVIVLSGKDDTMEKIICLEMGADDYMTKPYEMRELAARIKAVLRRSNDNAQSDEKSTANKAEKIMFDGWCLDRTQYQLFDKDEKSANLTTGEFKLLEALVLSPKKALSRELLFDLTRDNEYDSFDRAIDIQIARLRKKLGKDGVMIKTVRGIGYMFNSQI